MKMASLNFPCTNLQRDQTCWAAVGPTLQEYITNTVLYRRRQSEYHHQFEALIRETAKLLAVGNAYIFRIEGQICSVAAGAAAILKAKL